MVWQVVIVNSNIMTTFHIYISVTHPVFILFVVHPKNLENVEKPDLYEMNRI